MSSFITEDFMLLGDTARELYHQSAARMPIIDYHCHLVPQMIAQNYKFKNLTEAWLSGDHYKWRAMRGNGVDEQYITGNKTDYEKFEKWAATIPYAMRNPLYHWTHLELKHIFGVDKVLNPSTAREIYDECAQKLQSDEFSAQQLMLSSGVEAVCTTDDPIDSLEYHQQIKKNPFGVLVLPTWRPDKAMAIENPTLYNTYIDMLSKVSNMEIISYEDLLLALQSRHDYFAENGCKLADHGMDRFYAEDYTERQVKEIFCKIRRGNLPLEQEVLQFKTAMLVELARMNHAKGWVQQFHVGTIRNNNTKMFNALGVDSGFDAINDVNSSALGHKFLNILAVDDRLTKTILYNLNSKDNDVFATMAYTFNEGPIAGKIQYGAAWWFLDQEQGIIRQINSLSSMGLLGRFVGMLTDSRSFLSYPRHDYFRRILCNLLGTEIDQGKLPRSEMERIHQMVKDICYYNAKNYFNLK